jgi:hypothetical protein
LKKYRVIKIIVNRPGVFVLLWAIIIFILCATPGKYIPSASWLELLSVDKFVHATMFFILCGLLYLWAIKKNSKSILDPFGNLSFRGAKQSQVLIKISSPLGTPTNEAVFRKSLMFFFLTISAIAYGCLLEFMQAHYFIDRSADWLDIAANTFGCLLALVFVQKIKALL